MKIEEVEGVEYSMPFSIVMLLVGNIIGVTVIIGLVFESIVVGMEMVDNIIGSFDELLIGLVVIICVVTAGVTSAEKRN